MAHLVPHGVDGHPGGGVHLLDARVAAGAPPHHTEVGARPGGGHHHRAPGEEEEEEEGEEEEEKATSHLRLQWEQVSRAGGRE